MRLSSRDFLEIQKLVHEQGLETAWKRILIARIGQRGASFSYILSDAAFRGLSKGADLLENLSVGEISILYEFALAYADRTDRKQSGQYFTPDDISQFLARHSKSFPKSTIWVDPCSGVGNLSYWLIKEQSNPETFLTSYIYLVDKDPLALLTARVIFTLEFQNQEQRLFEKLANRCFAGDFLDAKNLPKFDAAILNPPYVSGVIKQDFETLSSRNLYAYFLERVANLCNEGYISITPQTFTNGARFRTLRAVLLRKHNALDVYCFDNVPDNIFSGFKFGSENTNKANSTRAGVIIARRSDRILHRVTPLLRWRSNEREQMLKNAQTFLAPVRFNQDVFPKVGKELYALYKTVQSFQTRLRDLISSEPTKYLLQVPTTPRYFISANKNPVNRSSFRTLYFHNQHDLDSAYILLNSSYMYWWWRVRDGGMTISEQTLLELPIPSHFDSKAAKHLVKQLEESEKISLVVKMNAGKPIENIKHPSELIETITRYIFPDEAKSLALTHSNSMFNKSPTPWNSQPRLAI